MRTATKLPMASLAGWVLLLGAGWALGGCGLFGAGQRVAPPTVAQPTAQEQAQYAQAESRLNATDPGVREEAAVSLLSMDYPDALPTVLDRLRHAPDPAVRISMIQAVAFVRDHRCFGQLLDAIEDPEPKVREQAAQALARFTQKQEALAITRKAAGVGPEAQQLLYRALGEGLAVSAVPALLDGLAASDEQVRTAAWDALERISGRDLPLDVEQWRKWWEANSQKTREDILEDHLLAMSARLESRSGELQSLQEQQTELMKLVQSPQTETPQQLLNALGSQHSVVKQYAAVRLAGLSDEQLAGVRIDDRNSYSVLAEALDDPSEQVRQNVLRFVLRVEGDYRPRLVRKALSDTSPAVLSLAIGAVEAGMGPEVTSRLQELLAQSPYAEVREAAAGMLGKIGSQDSAPALMTALDDQAENVRWFAVEGLRKLAAVQAVPRICEMLQKDRSARVREVAASALGELGQPAGIPALRMALDDASDRVRQKAVAALLALATDNYERMMVIAAAFREKALYGEARQVLANVLKTYRDDKEMKSQVADAYKALAQTEREQKDYPAATGTYQELDTFLGGSADARKEIVSTWLEAAAPANVKSAVEGWFAAAGATKDRALLEVGLDAAERLYAAGDQKEGAAVLQLVQQAAGPDVDPALAQRIQKLQQPGTP